MSPLPCRRCPPFGLASKDSFSLGAPWAPLVVTLCFPRVPASSLCGAASRVGVRALVAPGVATVSSGPLCLLQPSLGGLLTAVPALALAGGVGTGVRPRVGGLLRVRWWTVRPSAQAGLLKPDRDVRQGLDNGLNFLEPPGDGSAGGTVVGRTRRDRDVADSGHQIRKTLSAGNTP